MPLSHPLRLIVLSRCLVHAIPSCILPPQVQRHEDAQAARHGLQAQQGTVTGVVLGPVLGLVQVRGDHTAHVAEADVHRDADAALQGAANIVAVPGYALGHIGVNTAREEETAGVLDLTVLSGDEHGETDHTRMWHMALLVLNPWVSCESCSWVKVWE